MGKKLVFICDGTRDDGKGGVAPCGAVLVNAADGFVIAGPIKATVVDGERVLVSTPPSSGSQPDVAHETSLCRECMAKALGFHPS